MERLSLKQQWAFGFFLVASLTLGSSLLKHLDQVLVSNIFSKTQFIKNFSDGQQDYVDPIYVDPIEGGILSGLEMGLIPIFVLFFLGFYNKWAYQEMLNLAWKVFIVGSVLGLIFGSTYAINYQSLVCGIIH